MNEAPTTRDTNLSPNISTLSVASQNKYTDYEERFLVALEALGNHTPAADKLLLNIADAQQLTGLSRLFLLGAIKEEKLKAQKIGRGWKIKRKDLDIYIDNL